jgi:hypothetical protein
MSMRIEHFQKSGFVSKKTTDLANKVVDAVNGVSPLTGSGPIHVSSGGTNGAVIGIRHAYFSTPPLIGKVVGRGPTGQGDYADGDPRYWVQMCYVFPSNGKNTADGRLDFPTFNTDPKDKDHNDSIIKTVVNLAEIRKSVTPPGDSCIGEINTNDTHQLLVGTYVRVWRELTLTTDDDPFNSEHGDEPLERWVMHETPQLRVQGCKDQSDDCCDESFDKIRTAIKFKNGFLVTEGEEDQADISLNLFGCSGIYVSGTDCCNGIGIYWSGLYIENCYDAAVQYKEFRQAIRFGQGLKVSDITTSGWDCDGNPVDIPEALVELCLDAGSGIYIEPQIEGDYCCYKINASGLTISGCDGTVLDGIHDIALERGLKLTDLTDGAASLGLCLEAGNGVTIGVGEDPCCYKISASGSLTLLDCEGNAAATDVNTIQFGNGLKTTGELVRVCLEAGDGVNIETGSDPCCYRISASGSSSLTLLDCQGLAAATDVNTIQFGAGLKTTGELVQVCLEAGDGVTIETGMDPCCLKISASGTSGLQVDDCGGSGLSPVARIVFGVGFTTTFNPETGSALVEPCLNGINGVTVSGNACCIDIGVSGCDDIFNVVTDVQWDGSSLVKVYRPLTVLNGLITDCGTTTSGVIVTFSGCP